MSNDTKERKHHPFSPSRLEQYRLCPGSYWMQKGIPDVPSEAAAEGTLLHNAVATGNLAGLSEEQKDLVQQCFDFRGRIRTENNVAHVGSEVQLQVFKGNELLTDGFADDVFARYKSDGITIEHVIVVDYKFGWSPVTPAMDNIQAGTYCAGAMLKYGCPTAEAYIFQPRIHRSSSYVYHDHATMVDNIEEIISKAKDEEHLLLVPQETACRYCRARLSCPAFRMKFQNLIASSNTYDMNNPKVLEALMDASKDVKTFIREIEEAIRKVIEEKGRCGKYGFKITDGRREVKDLSTLYDRVAEYISQENFLGLCSVTLGKLENAVADQMVLQAAECGEKLSKTEAKRLFFDVTKDLISRGNQTKTIVVLP